MKHHFFGILSVLTLSLSMTATSQADIYTNRATAPIDRVDPAARFQAPVRMEMNELELAIHNEIDRYRQSLNLPPLAIDPIVSAQARAHSEEMARTGKMNHDGFDLRTDTVARRIPIRSAAENVAVNFGYAHPDLVAIQGWIASTGHHKNIIGAYDLTGIGVAQNAQGEYYFTQIFIRKQPKISF
jgi:uncharacterized protein YkwD